MPQVPAATVYAGGAISVDLDANPPPPRYKRVTQDSLGIIGAPCVWLNVREAAWEFGWRVASMPFIAADSGEWVAGVVPEAEWWAAAYRARTPTGGVRHLRIARVFLVG